MLIVSNEKMKLEVGETQMTYTEFAEKAFGEGLDVNDDIIINVDNIVDKQEFSLLSENGLNFFTLGTKPSFAESIPFPDYSNKIDSPYIPPQYAQPQQNTYTAPTSAESPSYTMESGPSDGPIIPDNITSTIEDEDNEKAINSLLNEQWDDDTENGTTSNNTARIVVFGSSKGGTGKTFTSLISTYRYAKTHPAERIAMVDFDIIDGQVGISIHKNGPTMKNYLIEYQKGYTDFRTMSRFAIKSNNFPQNIDFYLAPNNGTYIQNDNFWMNIIKNTIENYDVVVFDTGIDYLNLAPISYAYKIADKICIVTTTSIKSVNSVNKQINKLTGKIKNPVFTEEDGLAPRINIIITQMVQSNKMNRTIYNNLSNSANICATFGVITESISEAEYYGNWKVFDNNPGINKALDTIMS